MNNETQIARPKKPRYSPPYSWNEVEDVLSGVVSPDDLGDAPTVAPGPCYQCGNPMKWLNWRNSDECWGGECGVAGWLPICETCRCWGKLDGMVLT